MNILFLIGNGFDIKLGLQTRYKDFYNNAYQMQSNDINSISKLKFSIQKDIETWADLEVKLGEYTKELENREEFDVVFDDIRENLANYISQQEKTFQFDIALKNSFLQDMKFPYKFLAAGEQKIFKDFIGKISGSALVQISTISFNYTHSLERIFEYSGKHIEIDKSGGNTSTFNEIEHIHGVTDKRFILGVDNIEQIAKESFREDDLILDSFVKPRQNSAAQHLSDERCKAMINASSVICIFGMSIGATDKTWWNYIGNRMLGGNLKLIIFWHDEKIIPLRFTDKLARRQNEIREQFLLMSSLADSDKKKIFNNIYIAYNSEIFSVK